jgi:hypothetical protein
MADGKNNERWQKRGREFESDVQRTSTNHTGPSKLQLAVNMHERRTRFDYIAVQCGALTDSQWLR